jgi:alkylation response protein AidB-like acyl-CoA dehydrogenase
MDFGLTEEQELLRKTARDFLTENCPKSFVRQMEVDEKGYSPQLWKRMAELGWTGLLLPEEYGGTGGNWLDLVILLEEMGRALLPGPFVPTTVYVSPAILRYGTEEQKSEFLPGIASGKLVMTLALTEPSARYDEAGIKVQARQEDGDWVIHGVKLFVPDAHVADWVICVARASEGVTLFLVDAKSPGVNHTVLDTIASDKQCEVLLNQVRVPHKNILGEVGKGWEIVERIKEWGALAQCALISGIVQQVLELTVSYAKERVQFDRPIGSFQAIGHKCANMAMDVEGVKYLTYQAAWRLSQGLPATVEVAMAKAWASEAVERVCLEGFWVHGGVGIAQDHDLPLYARRAKVVQFTLGDSYFHREIVSQQMGL